MVRDEDDQRLVVDPSRLEDQSRLVADGGPAVTRRPPPSQIGGNAFIGIVKHQDLGRGIGLDELGRGTAVGYAVLV